MRREGLYTSHLSNWRRARDQGQLDALAPKRRGPKPDPTRAASKREQRLEREVARLRKRIETAETIIDVQRKLSRLLNDPLLATVREKIRVAGDSLRSNALPRLVAWEEERCGACDLVGVCRERPGS